MNTETQEISEILLNKSVTKQFIYKNTCEYFSEFKTQIKILEKELFDSVSVQNKEVVVTSAEEGQFEARLQFSGDDLVFNMHTNIFSFEDHHPLLKLGYVKENPMRSYCGMIEIYNFLADSLKYTRIHDIGYLVGRLFINMDGNFFAEGKGQLGFLFQDFQSQKLDPTVIRKIIEVSMKYALDFDLWAPRLEDVMEMTVLEKIQQQGMVAHKTAKRLGFSMSWQNNSIK